MNVYRKMTYYLIAGLLSLLSMPGLAQPVERIISLAPSLTELVFSAGAGDKLVGVVSYSNYPAEATQISQIGHFDNLNLERIIELQPDLILAWRASNKPQDIARLQNMGFRVLVRDTQQLDDIPNLIEEIGRLTNQTDTAHAEAERLRQQLSYLRAQYQDKSPVKVFYQVWNQPLITVNDEQFIGQAMALCGGINIFADQTALAPHVSREAVINANPDLILLGGMGEVQQAWLTSWQAIPLLTAQQTNQIFMLNADLYQRPTARLIDGLAHLCRLIDQTRSAKQLNRH
ncbi:ABC transporter substrate-binding protein [Thiomicrospira aerophila AL3]|uniref:ABC transporter substrate-binding protein n=1 Tax=Thiomicrospira aerophila AL3 TaxID=717772 RepID=W0DW30_9GAMM|nr:cobalamin-binding protein [Thiomicrospira aerophila]AHF01493.1 ABC transporter substrate-binding protein [Thiomicrospira aerophila AL3]